MFIVMKIQTEFTAVNVNSIPAIIKDEETGLMGVLPVYATKEQARAVFPYAELIEVKEEISGYKIWLQNDS